VDVVLAPARGLPSGLTIPGVELEERFSRSSGPGGQGVNTADSRVELIFDVANSRSLTDAQRDRLLIELHRRLVDGVLIIAASEHRSQLQNRTAARARLANLLRAGLEPPSPPRRATRPTRGSKERRIEGKKRRSRVKANRGRVQPD
jgi:ribosome-associated protein